MRVVLYTRKSDDDKGISQEAQTANIEEYCRKNGHELVRAFDETVGTKGGKRGQDREAYPLLLAAIADKGRDFDAVVVTHTDRIFRNPEEHFAFRAWCRKYKCRLISILNPVDWDSPQGEFMDSLWSLLAKLEADLVGQRIYLHNAARAMAGKWPCGYPPLGYTYNGETQTLSANKRAEDAVKVFAYYLEANGSARATAQRLTLEGVSSPRESGNHWRNGRILKIVQNPIYRQRVSYDGKETENLDIPRIVPKELTDAVDAILPAMKKRPTRTLGSKNPFSGFLRCSECGSRLSLKQSGGGISGSTVSWCCVERVNYCHTRHVGERWIKTLTGRAIAELLRYVEKGCVEATAKPPEINTDAIEARRKQIQQQRERLLQLYESGLRDWQYVSKRANELNAEIDKLSEPAKAPLISFAMVRDLLDNFEDDWSLDESGHYRRHMLTLLGAEIIVNTGERPLWVELRVEGFPSIRASCKRTRRKSASV